MRLTPWPEVVERAGTGIAVVDAATDLVRAVNPAFAMRRGCQPEQMIGRHTEELFPPGEFVRVRPRLQVADRVYCFQEGRLSLTGRPRELSREQIHHAYFG